MVVQWFWNVCYRVAIAMRCKYKNLKKSNDKPVVQEASYKYSVVEVESKEYRTSRMTHSEKVYAIIGK